MDTHLKKSVIRMPFESVFDQLKGELFKEGFEIAGLIDLQVAGLNAPDVPSKRHTIMTVYNPFLYGQMMLSSPSEGTILPCVISVIETYPGQTTLVRYNGMESLARGSQNASFQNLAIEVTKRLELAILPLETAQSSQPDLVTSWS